jgi:hypothetical protein
MKAITIWQPWASLLAIGAKKYETRSWPTKYRGTIAIHAAKKDPCKIPLIGLEKFDAAAGTELERAGLGSTWFLLPRGKIIATAELVDVWHIVHNPGVDVDTARHIPIGAESLTNDRHAPDFVDYFVPTEQEILFGDWTPGRYAWEIANVKMLPSPVPAAGHQSLWEWNE